MVKHCFLVDVGKTNMLVKFWLMTESAVVLNLPGIQIQPHSTCKTKRRGSYHNSGIQKVSCGFLSAEVFCYHKDNNEIIKLFKFLGNNLLSDLVTSSME